MQQLSVSNSNQIQSILVLDDSSENSNTNTRAVGSTFLKFTKNNTKQSMKKKPIIQPQKNQEELQLKIYDIEEIDSDIQIVQKPSYKRKTTAFEAFEDAQDNQFQWFEAALKVEPRERQIQRQKRMQAQEEESQIIPYYKYKTTRNLYKKVFKQHEYIQLRKYFQIFYNQQDDPQTFSQQPQGPKITSRFLAQKYKCSITTISSLYKQWRFDPTFSKQLSKFRRIYSMQLPHGPPKIVTAHQLTDKRLKQMIKIIEVNPFLSQAELVHALRKLEPIENSSFDLGGLARLLKFGRYKRKKLRILSKDRNSAQNIQLRRQFALKLQEYIQKDFPVFFYDEMLIHEHFAQIDGWAREGNDVAFKPQDKINQSIVVLGLFSMQGKFLWDAKYGDYSPSQLKATIARFFKTVNESPQRGVIIVNPLPYRNMNILYETIRYISWEILPLPVQGLQLNPLYSYYFDMKECLRKLKFTTIEDFFGDVVMKLKEKDDSRYGKKYIEQMSAYVKRAIARQQF